MSQKYAIGTYQAIFNVVAIIVIMALILKSTPPASMMQPPQMTSPTPVVQVMPYPEPTIQFGGWDLDEAPKITLTYWRTPQEEAGKRGGVRGENFLEATVRLGDSMKEEWEVWGFKATQGGKRTGFIGDLGADSHTISLAGLDMGIPCGIVIYMHGEENPDLWGPRSRGELKRIINEGGVNLSITGTH